MRMGGADGVSFAYLSPSPSLLTSSKAMRKVGYLDVHEWIYKFEVISNHHFSPFVLLNFGGLFEGIDTFLGQEFSHVYLDAHGDKLNCLVLLMCMIHKLKLIFYVHGIFFHPLYACYIILNYIFLSRTCANGLRNFF
jgi:hypothetical protein